MVAIPRGQVAIAAGHAEPDAKKLVLKAERGTSEYGICSTTFLEPAFRTDSYQIEVDFHDDGSWSYVLETMLQVRGQAEPFLHRDENRLTKVAGAGPQPLGDAGAVTASLYRLLRSGAFRDLETALRISLDCPDFGPSLRPIFDAADGV